MDTMDPKREREVWQRVRGEMDLPGELKKLAAREWADAAVYLALSRRVQGQPSAVLKKMILFSWVNFMLVTFFLFWVFIFRATYGVYSCTCNCKRFCF